MRNLITERGKVRIMASYETSDMEQMMRSTVREMAAEYDEEYWLEISDHAAKELIADGPNGLWKDLAEAGWLGANIPEEYGGQGMGMQEIVMIIEEVGLAGGWPATPLFLPTSVFGGETLTKHGSKEQKETWLPRLANGEFLFCLGVTEPNAGLETTNIDTFAEKDGDEYVINGEKTWTTMAAFSDRIVLLARTLPRAEADSPSHGLSMFLVDPDNPGVEITDEIPLSLHHHDPSYSVYYDDVRIHESQLLGEEHEGLFHIFDVLNTERIGGAAAAWACGRYALQKASDYANNREVFGTRIGTYQAIQHPLADAFASLETARLATHKAAWMYDHDKETHDVGATSNISNLKACEAGWEACEAAMTTFGGMSASAEIGISQIWQEVRHMRTAPVSEQMLRNYLAERELDLPRSY
jgi:acyl-CoA dehydrogenase